jgi:hypothetical protein
MKIYPLNKQQRNELVALNKNNVNWAACDYENVGIAIEEYTLNDPDYIEHKALFESWNITEYVEIQSETTESAQVDEAE